MSNANLFESSKVGTLRDIDLQTGKSLPCNSVDKFREIGDNTYMTNNSSNNTWTVQFLLNEGDAIVTRTEDDIYEVEVLGDLVAEADTIEEAFALAEDMISFHDAVNVVVNEVEEEIEELENELFALDKIAEYLYTAGFDPIDIYSFLEDEINEQLELLEALDNYDYDMFVEDREEAELDALIDALIEDEESFEENFKAEEERFEAEVNGNVRGPFSVI